MKDLIKKVFPYFSFSYRYLGSSLLVLYFMSILAASLDALGITLIIPLLKLIDEKNIQNSDVKENYFSQFFKFLSIEFTIGNILLFIASIFVLKGVVKFLQSKLKLDLRATLIKKLREKLLEGFFNLDYIQFIRTNSGKITNTFNSETQQVSSSFNLYNSALISIFTIACYVIFAIIANPLFAVGSVVAGGTISLFMRKLTVSTKKQSINLASNNESFSNFLVQTVYNYKYLKTTGINQNFKSKIFTNVKNLMVSMKKISFNTSLATSIREPFIIILLLILIVINVKIFHQTVSSVMIALFLFYRCLNEIVQFQSNWQNFISSYGSFHSVNESINLFNKEKEPTGKLKIQGFDNNIKLHDITFYFNNDGVKIIDNINIEIHKNTTVAFVGESGSGKTTLVDLLTGLLRPTHGKILIDGKDLNSIDKNLWRTKIGYIAQEQVVFNDSILNNVSLWDVSVEQNLVRNKVLEACKKANCQFVFDNIDGIDMMIGDRGVNLSGGQKQRLAIARELYKEVEILILDEATSALDSESENIIKTNIDEMKGNFTLIIIAHRLSTIKNADKIFVINKGKITESGNYNELVSNKNSKFSEMTSFQNL